MYVAKNVRPQMAFHQMAMALLHLTLKYQYDILKKQNMIGVTIMQKHAFLIIAHHQFELLEKLILMLDHPNNDIYIHISKSVKNFDFTYFSELTKKSKIYFTKRIKVTWGGSSQIKCELIMLKSAIKKKYDYYHLLSGVDLPIKPMEQIHRFFEINSGKELVQMCSKEIMEKCEILERISTYHIFQNILGRSKNKILLKKIKNNFIRLQKHFNINRWKNRIDDIGYGANWFSITHSLAETILSKSNYIRKHFKYTLCADEVFLQTMVNKLHFRNNIFVYDKKHPGSNLDIMRFIDWKRGNPYVFRSNDFEQLTSSPCLFARKFDINIDKEIIDKIFNFVIKEQ